jgi:hypothetical protein
MSQMSQMSQTWWTWLDEDRLFVAYADEGDLQIFDGWCEIPGKCYLSKTDARA